MRYCQPQAFLMAAHLRQLMYQDNAYYRHYHVSIVSSNISTQFSNVCNAAVHYQIAYLLHYRKMPNSIRYLNIDADKFH